MKYTTDHAKAQVLADRLENVFNEDPNNNFDSEHFDHINQQIESDAISKLYKPREKLAKKFTMRDLTKSIKNINNKTSIDQNGISNKILKHVSEITKECMLALFNRCIEKNKIPTLWKNSIVTMIHKKGTEACRVKSYRPISITPCIARLFERTILSRLKSHLTENNLIIKPQSGFRNFRQTKDNLVFLSQKVQQSFIGKKKNTRNTI